MSRRRVRLARVCLIVAPILGGALASSGCGPASEGRPAGSIEVKNARSSTATEAKTKTMPPGR